ncbi:DUF4124 domain-containing protein [Ottowia sp.]|jgi:hypothetical protein|uniref:DUF4124 domain-containing protein n=1 Tax=Ottowia sp. TaxID=1898956 RepID=UPI0025D3EA69|nr:DUF4124 domain-containing protein [Ottowia sp.]MBK6612838.1 DUF4124 domain-containing protein [Ottowia sp.]MBK6748034.1 DUF4124 domain-containing protein [Ottowia sp.]
MKPARALLIGWTLAASTAVTAQYQWIDPDGRRVFSDRPPPAEVPARNVLSQPRGASTVAARAAPAPAQYPAGVDKALEEKKKQADAAEAARKKAEETKLATARADNCKRAQSAKAGLDSGVRIARTNSQGEREILDDAQRAAERQRVQQIIASNCK